MKLHHRGGGELYELWTESARELWSFMNSGFDQIRLWAKLSITLSNFPIDFKAKGAQTHIQIKEHRPTFRFIHTWKVPEVSRHHLTHTSCFAIGNALTFKFLPHYYTRIFDTNHNEHKDLGILYFCCLYTKCFFLYEGGN